VKEKNAKPSGQTGGVCGGDTQAMNAVNLCLILAAGKGSRIASVASGGPKPLVPLCGLPLLEHVMTSSREAKIERFVIVAGYRADSIRRWLSDRSMGDISVTLIEIPEY
jgi:NDP-sugar pyrophosphorylase family protein